MKYSYVYTSKIRQAFFADTLLSSPPFLAWDLSHQKPYQYLYFVIRFSVEDDILAVCTSMNPAVFT